MFNENSIAQTLKEIVEDIRQGNLENAQTQLDVLEFERLRKPIKDNTVGSPIQFRDPAALLGFGVDRVNETGNYILECQSALSLGDSSAAMDAAQKALQRWQEA